MAAPTDVEQPASRRKESSRKHRASYDSTYTGDGSHSNSNSNTKSVSIKLSVDPSVLAMVSAVRDDIDSDDGSQKRQSQLFCFFCCDLVKACIIMNAVHILISIIHIVISVMKAPIGFRIDLYERYGEVYDDDEVLSLPLNPWGVIGYLKIAFGFLFAIVAIIGARLFSQKLLLASVFWDCCYTILSIANQEWSVFFISIPFLYTDVHLYMALRSGNITPENYETEEHCCCAKGGCS